jgi:Methylase involved in ubiquinone/menaquinone biosynthesis
MLPEVSGLSGLDVGCGEGTNTRKVAELGAKMSAIDIAEGFIEYARETEKESPLGVEYRVADARELPFRDGTFDFATAFMSMMDVMDPGKVLREVRRVVRPGGFFQFSILHPCFAPPHRKVLRHPDGKAYAIEIADYYVAGRHHEQWYFSQTTDDEKKTVKPFQVPYIHLTLTMWVELLDSVGFRLKRFGEPKADAEAIRKCPELQDTDVAGIFLHVLAYRT